MDAPMARQPQRSCEIDSAGFRNTHRRAATRKLFCFSALDCRHLPCCLPTGGESKNSECASHAGIATTAPSFLGEVA
jgi:hypothetical protein